jgi:hypothetical protein
MDAILAWIVATFCVVFAVVMLAGVFVPDSWVDRWRQRNLGPQAKAVMRAARKLMK